MKKNMLVKGIVMMVFIAMLFSCRNDLKTVEAFAVSDSIPSQIIKDVVMYRTDSGYLKAKIISDLVHIFDVEDAYTVFPEGISIVFYNREGVEESTLDADYGVSYDKRKLLIARKNVIVKNLLKKEQLNTEELNWDQRKKIIFSNTKVKIITTSEIIYGTGLHSDDRFDRYEIKDPTGEVQVKEEEVEN